MNTYRQIKNTWTYTDFTKKLFIKKQKRRKKIITATNKRKQKTK